MSYQIVTFLLFLLLCALLLWKRRDHVQPLRCILAFLLPIPFWCLFWYLLYEKTVFPLSGKNILQCLGIIGMGALLFWSSLGKWAEDVVFLYTIAILFHEFALNFSMVSNKYIFTKENIIPAFRVSPLLIVYYAMVLLFIVFLRVPEPVEGPRARKAFEKTCLWTLAATSALHILYVSHVIHVREVNDTLFILLVMSEVCALSFLINHYSARQLYAVELELEAQKRLKALREQQFQAASQSQAAINLKCHDLKHYIFYLKQAWAHDWPRILEEMEEAVNTFDQKVHSGHPDLDTVLTEEMNLFQQDKIEFHCMADGAALSFMNTLDLYVLFGNILDNCREGVLNEKDPERRLVSLRIARKQEMVIIETENYSDHKPTLVDGLPLTSKEGTGDHGLGLRSVRSIVESYGGFLNVRYDSDIFTLRILLPYRCGEASL